jgi:hypothetical protein
LLAGPHKEEIDNAVGGAGIIIKGSYETVKTCDLTLLIEDDVRKSIIFSIASALAKKYVFGF